MADDHERYREAGRVAAEALRLAVSRVRHGVSMRAILDEAEAFIRAQGCEPAFPAQSCVNDVAAHYCPTEAEDYTYHEGDLVKVDVGAHKDGYIGDNATTISLNGPESDRRLAQAVRDALAAVESILKAGVTPDEIGQVVQDTIKAAGFQPIRNLTGHGLARFVQHAKPNIPNYPCGEREPLRAGMVIAIEPFATDGTSGLITDGSAPTIYSIAKERPVRSPYAREALALIRRYQGLPFAARWLTSEIGGRTLLGLNELRRAGVLHAYPPLVEKSGGKVAQHENTYLITEDGFERLT